MMRLAYLLIHSVPGLLVVGLSAWAAFHHSPWWMLGVAAGGFLLPTMGDDRA